MSSFNFQNSPTIIAIAENFRYESPNASTYLSITSIERNIFTIREDIRVSEGHVDHRITKMTPNQKNWKVQLIPTISPLEGRRIEPNSFAI